MGALSTSERRAAKKPKSLGRIAYEASTRVFVIQQQIKDFTRLETWNQQTYNVKKQWEAAANAVMTEVLSTIPPRMVPPSRSSQEIAKDLCKEMTDLVREELTRFYAEKEGRTLVREYWYVRRGELCIAQLAGSWTWLTPVDDLRRYHKFATVEVASSHARSNGCTLVHVRVFKKAKA